jgi:hypothetical protein
MSSEKRLWPNVNSPGGRAFAFRLSMASGVFAALAALLAAVLFVLGHQNILGYSGAGGTVPLAVVACAIAVCAGICAAFIRLERGWAAWSLLIVIITAFLADAWFGKGRFDWVAIALTILAIQGVRAALVRPQT